MRYYIVVERELICVQKDKWDRISVPFLRMQNGQNACTIAKNVLKRCGLNL